MKKNLHHANFKHLMYNYVAHLAKCQFRNWKIPDLVVVPQHTIVVKNVKVAYGLALKCMYLMIIER